MDLSATLFDPMTGDLLPDYRELYLHGSLPPALQQTVEDYLKRSPIQTNIILGRYHQLAAEAQRKGQTFVPPQWVQQQLVFQPSMSATGPLRRPAVRTALGVLLVLCGASVVQWIRNEPLVPAPVVEAVTTAATSVSRTTQNLARKGLATLHITDTAKFKPKPAVAVVKPLRPAPVQPAYDAARPEPVRPTKARSVAILLTDSATLVTNANEEATTEDGSMQKGIVRGRIFNQGGEPLVGATVLVVGSKNATSTNANGEYTLEVPAGALLQFGYAGCTDIVLRCRLNETLDVTLEDERQRRRASL